MFMVNPDLNRIKEVRGTFFAAYVWRSWTRERCGWVKLEQSIR